MTEPGGAASKASRLRLGSVPFEIAARRSSRIGIDRIVHAAPQKVAAAGLRGRLSGKKRVCSPFWNMTADSVGTPTDIKRVRTSSGTGA